MTQTSTTAYTSLSAQYGRLVSAALRVAGVSLAGFLQQAQGSERFYWENSRDDVAFAGVGAALELFAVGVDRFRSIHHRAMELFGDSIVLNEEEPLAAPRLFGGFSFTDDFVPDVAWSNFPPAHFVLPHYQLVRIGDIHWLTINTHVQYGENPRLILPELKDALQIKAQALQDAQVTPASQTMTDLNYPMVYGEWERIINDATTRMKNGDLNKVVLSRVAEARFKRRFTVDAALNYLAEAYPETYRFIFEPRPYHAFFGATPELLVKVKHRKAHTMALAGSIQRGDTPEADSQYAQALLDSEKDRYEHQLVIDGIHTRLEPLAKSVKVGETGIMQLSNIQHIHTPISATLHRADGVIPVVDALHPTPALGGDPAEIAMNLISHYEPVPRGWYAAPVGWIDRRLDGEFGVAIRSAVAQEKRVWLYAGAGIVKDSDPQKEWDETQLKFTPMLDALNAE
jgi:menaquinone-specific isochorismate synthase